jgi:hypothetical protein
MMLKTRIERIISTPGDFAETQGAHNTSYVVRSGMSYRFSFSLTISTLSLTCSVESLDMFALLAVLHKKGRTFGLQIGTTWYSIDGYPPSPLTADTKDPAK